MATQNSVNNVLFGVTNGSNATAGYVGEVISSNITQASAIGISNNSTTNLTSISLTAGDWDVWGNIAYIPATGTVASEYVAAISLSSGSFPDTSLCAEFNILFPATAAQDLNAPLQRINVSGTTIIYIVGYALFSTSTMKMCGGIYARRTR